MAFFKRRPHAASDANNVRTNQFIGRRFESASSVATCLEAYETVLPRLYAVAGPATVVDWIEPTIPAGWESSQFKQLMPRAPDKVLGHPVRGGEMIYLATWDNGADRLNNLWFVPPGFDHTEVGAIGGAWFYELKAAGHKPVVSDGLVESTEWGLPT